MNINGSCFCKKIVFKGEVDPEKCFACHCEDCQIFSGAPYRGVVQCEKTNLNIKGRPKEYIKIGFNKHHKMCMLFFVFNKLFSCLLIKSMLIVAKHTTPDHH